MSFDLRLGEFSYGFTVKEASRMLENLPKVASHLKFCLIIDNVGKIQIALRG